MQYVCHGLDGSIKDIMTSAVTPEWLQARIDATKAMIEEYESAVLKLSTGTVKSYTINTGQTTQSVTKKDISRLQADIDSLYQRLDYYDMRLNGGGPAIYVRGA